METGQLAQAAVVGLPAGDAGEKIHAVVVPIESADFNSDEIMQHCARKLPLYMIPKSIEVLDMLPETPNGKIDYKFLRAQRMEQAG
jgi:acyl-CoA synthetase (AMP-forming)/AMP-acid ligase II